MKDIFLTIQEKLGEIPELQYVDKNWQQLQYDPPPVKFPCALLDVSSVDYTQMGNRAQMAEASVEITVANVRLHNSSSKAPHKADAYAVFALIDKIHQLLHGFTNGQFQRLTRIGVQRVQAEFGYEIYTVTFRTAWAVCKQTSQIPLPQPPEGVVVL
jgi:hypothetical protein